MNMDFLFDFKNLNDLKNMNDRVQKAQSMSDKKQKSNSFESNSDVEYSFDNKTFSRKVTLKNFTKEQQAAYDKEIKQAASIFDETVYRIVYRFDDPIQSVSIDGGRISQDGKTFTLEMPMDSVLKNPLLLNFEVKLK